MAPGGADCSLRGCCVIVYFWVDHLRNDWVVLFVLHDPSDGLDEGIGASTKAFASASGRSNTMAMSISPPSFLIRAGLPACIRSRIATALFSHRFRSHSSIARCASDPVCGGHSGRWGSQCREECTIGQCSSGHCCKGRDGPAYVTVLHIIGGDVFCAMADSEFAHSCCKVKPGLGSMYFLFHTAL